MKKEDKKKAGAVHFTEQTPQIQIGDPKLSEQYKKAFLESEAGESEEHSPNTTSWD